MKTLKINKIAARLILILIVIAAFSCEDMFNDPLKDKDTGDDITVLLLDRNFIKTKLLIWFVDAKTNEPVEDELIELQIWGTNAGRLITFSGEKPDVFTTDIGFLELGYDPNFEIDKNNPLEITIMATGERAISAPQSLSFTTEGVKDVIIKMNRTIPGQSSKSGSLGEPFDLYYNGSLNSPDLHFVTDISSSPTGTGYEYLNLYATLAAGGILCNNLQDESLYDDFGIYYNSPSSGFSIVPPSLPVREAQLASGDYIFSTILKSGVDQCENGLTIRVDRADGEPGTGSFSYLITFSTGDTKSGQISGSFPMEHLIEPIYYPEADPSVMVQIFGDSQYDFSGPVNLPSPCGGIAEFTASPKSNLRTYKFITQYICPDNPIGFALSINGQFRKSESIDPWTSFQFVEGICELELVEGSDYDFRVPIDGVYQNYTLPTDPALLEDFLQENQGADYQIKELSITTLETKTEIFAIMQVSDEVCQDLNAGGNRR